MRHAAILGLVLGAFLIHGPDGATPAPARPTIAAWVIHFDPEFGVESAPAHARLLESLPRGVPVHVAVPNDRVREEFLDFLGRDLVAASSVDFITTESPLISPWARDRYVIVDAGAGPVVVLPIADSVAGERVGDVEIGERVAAKLGIPVIRTDIDFEGGNILIDDDTIVVGYGLMEMNVALGHGESDVRTRLRRTFGRRPVVVGSAATPPPHEHVDMYLAIAGGQRAVVADPRLAEAWFDSLRDLGVEYAEVPSIGALDRFSGQDFTPLYDAVAADLTREAYSVVRIPVVHTEAGGILTWTNVVTGTVGDDPRPRAWVPDYGIPILDRAAQHVWRELGFVVEPVPCRPMATYGGAFRCMTNVVPSGHAVR